MINLLNDYNQESRDFHQSLIHAGLSYPTFVCQDDGFLPEGVESVYQVWLNNTKQGVPLYLNEIDVPPYWEITGTNQAGEIFDYHHKRGQIHFANINESRIVKLVDWYDEQGKIRWTDGYNKYGLRYKRTIFTKDQRAVTTSYFDSDGQEKIVYNHHTKTLILAETDGVQSFQTETDFILYTLQANHIDLTAINYNTLALPFLVVYNSQATKVSTLVWQEDTVNEIPGNMQLILNGQTSTKQIIVTNSLYAKHLRDLIGHNSIVPVIELGYIYPFKSNKALVNEAIIATNSDQIMFLEEIASHLPELKIHVVALTEMSARLTDLDHYENIQLYPNTNLSKIRSLYERVGWLLDINQGNEIVNAVRSAFDYQMVIVGFTDTVHNPAFMYSNLNFSSDQMNDLIKLLKVSIENPEVHRKLLNSQKNAANAVNKADYVKLFDQLEG